MVIMCTRASGMQILGNMYRERREAINPFTVAVVKSQVTVGHIPRKIHQSVPCFSDIVGQSTVELQPLGATQEICLKEDWNYRAC